MEADEAPLSKVARRLYAKMTEREIPLLCEGVGEALSLSLPLFVDRSESETRYVEFFARAEARRVGLGNLPLIWS